MGSSYSNITLHGPARDAIIKALEARGRLAFVGPDTGGFVVVFDEAVDVDPDQSAHLAAELSAALNGLALAATVYDDDIFLYALARDGQVVDMYTSAPGYGEGGVEPPAGGDAAVLSAAFGSGDAGAVERILRTAAGEDGYLFESQRHADLAEVLGLPTHSVGLGFGYIHEGDDDQIEGEITLVGSLDRLNQPPMDLQAQLAATPAGQEAMERIAAIEASAKHPAHAYFRALLGGDAPAVRALFAGEPLLDDPVSGRVDGGSLDAHVAAVQGLFAGGTAQYTPVGMFETDERVVSHGQIVSQMAGEMVVLPCACVWERADDGYRELRAYWSPAALKQQRGDRAPLLPPSPDLPLPDAVARHLAALAADDLPALMATYDETCLSPMPIPWLDPADTVRRQYGAQLGQQGAVVLTPCAVTTNDEACAVEWVTTKWDGADIPPQAGLSIYDLRGGRVCQAHLFGDLAPAPSAGGLDALGGLAGLGGMGGLGDLGGLGGLGDLGALGGMPGGMEITPEAMQQAMDEVMRMMGNPSGLADMMKGIQEMMGGGGMPGMPGPGGQGMPGMEAFGMEMFGAFEPPPGEGDADPVDDDGDAGGSDVDDPDPPASDDDVLDIDLGPSGNGKHPG